jgi:uncharacterized protein
LQKIYQISRNDDDFTGRFFQVDPLWEKYYSWTPYHYSGNNPVSFLDILIFLYKLSIMKSNADIIDEIKKKLVDSFDPLSIYLFGSNVWGKPNINSDIDILMIIDDSIDSKAKRATKAYRALRGVSMGPLDILIRTKKEISKLSNEKMSLINKILFDGKKLYERE